MSGYHVKVDNGPLFSPRAISRTKDPSTSKQAEKELRQSGRLSESCERTLRELASYIRRTGVNPTSHELAGDDLRLRYAYSRRLADLRSTGHVIRSGKRVCKITGKVSMTWAVRS